MPSPHTSELEQILTVFVRRMTAVQLDDASAPVERSAYALLAALHDSGAQRLSSLAGLVGLDKSTVSRQLDALQSRGMVERQPDPADGRAQLVALTEDGQRVFQATRSGRQRRLREAVSGWSEQDLATVTDLLGRLHADLFPQDVAPSPVPTQNRSSS